MGLIELKNLSKTYGEGNSLIKALDNINLVIEKGDLIAIMGPSGSGKSTLLNIIGFMDTQDKGEYILEGKNLEELTELNLAKLRNKKIGFIFQNFNLLNNQNPIYNVSLPLLYSENKKNFREKSREILTKVEIDEVHFDKEVAKLSGGQKQRVAIARALVNNPQIILADEPTGALDKNTGDTILELLLNINKEGKTVIIVTHDIEVAKKCSKIITIVDGKIATSSLNDSKNI